MKLGLKYLIVFLLVVAMLVPGALAVDDKVCAVYFTGIGCPHCAKAAPIIDRVLADTPNLVLIKYEVFEDVTNAPVLDQYASAYGVEPGIPLLIFSKDSTLQGDSDIISKMKITADGLGSNACPLPDGSSVDYSSLNASELIGNPEIYVDGKKVSAGGAAVTVDLTLLNIAGLAIVDAINPCAFAVLLLMLLAIMTNNRKNKKMVLIGGLTFVFSIFLIYFIYGLIIIKFFQLVQMLGSMKIFIRYAVSILAVLLGILNIRDYFSYAPGRAGTEMPLTFRPKVRKLIEKVSSPWGAFTTGVFVAVFLLPCTIGPYVIAAGILSGMGYLQAMPWLLVYNLIFVMPMLIIALFVGKGLSKVENLSDWKDKNIRRIHLAEGIIMLVLGVLMFLGWA